MPNPRRRLSSDELARLRSQVSASFGEPSLPRIPSLPDPVREVSLEPKMAHELIDDRYSNPISFTLTVHHRSNAEGSFQALAENKRRQYLLIQNLSAGDPGSDIYINFGNQASVLAGLRIASGTSYAPQIVVPNGAIYILVNSDDTQQVIVIEGAPIP